MSVAGDTHPCGLFLGLAGTEAGLAGRDWECDGPRRRRPLQAAAVAMPASLDAAYT